MWGRARSLPSRARFSWNINNVPWTDGKGNQEDYGNSVKLWFALHSKLSDGNRNKITTKLQDLMLQSQLYGRARDLCKMIHDTTIQSDAGVEAIVQVI